MNALEQFLMTNVSEKNDVIVENAKEVLELLKEKALTHCEAITTLECVKALLADSVI